MLLILNIIIKNSNIWKCVDKKEYLVFISLSKILLGLYLFFWQKIMENQNNKFCQ